MKLSAKTPDSSGNFKLLSNTTYLKFNVAMLLALINVYRDYLKIMKYPTHAACDLSVSGAFAFLKDACRQVLTFHKIVHVCGRVEHILLFYMVITKL